MTDALELEALPGGEIVSKGLEDLDHRRDSPESNAVLMAATRLRAAGVPVPEVDSLEPPAHRLYGLLAARHGDSAHARYNAIVRRMVSFARAAEHARVS